MSLLEIVRGRIAVDCDTLDVNVARIRGPFVDCTSNQAIVAAELLQNGHEALIKQSIQQGRELYDGFKAHGVTLESLIVDIIAVNLQAAILPHIKGNVHVQINPHHAYSNDKTILNAKRIVLLFSTLHQSLDASRVCVKIPSTWEGLMACRTLKAFEIKTLATTLFNIEQAALAGHAQCTYIAPYVNELKVHFEPGHVDKHPGFAVVHASTLYFRRTGSNTKVMPASLTSIEEVMRLVDKADHITVAPKLLTELAAASGQTAAERLESAATIAETGAHQMSQRDLSALLEDEAAFKAAVASSNNGRDALKLKDALDIFCAAQDQLEALVRRYMAELQL